MMRYIRLFKNISNWWLHFAVKLGLTDIDPLIFRTRNNIVVEVPRRLLHEFKEIFMEECYVRGIGLAVPDRPTIIDIGANAAFFSLFAASQFPGAKIFSYEPIVSNFRQLEHNRSLNKDVQMMCFQKAVYGYSGELSLYFDPDDNYTTSGSVFEGQDADIKTIRVPCVALSEILDEHHIARCDFLKIDCEGSEYDILYNCPANYLSRIARMAIEVHQGKAQDQNIESLAGYLNSHGFKIRRSDNMLWVWRDSQKS